MNDDKLVGFPATENLIYLGNNRFLDKETGEIFAQDAVEFLEESVSSISSVPADQQIEIVQGISKTKIDLSLKDANGNIAGNGFLVEVFLSGSDGKLTRLYREDIVDAINEESVREGFSNFMTLEVDK